MSRRRQAEAERTRADAALRAARAERMAMEAELRLARAERDRVERRRDGGNASRAAWDQVVAELARVEAELTRAEAHIAMREAEREVAEAALIALRPIEDPPAECLTLRAPIGGVVLERHRQSGGWVAAGEPLLNRGDPRDLPVATFCRGMPSRSHPLRRRLSRVAACRI